jgi:2-polyprenyl-6-methoxyphenol hydroxylase-like FAD-dependent oxidoreductase
MFFDVIIVGAGLVGASLALALRGSGLRVALLEPWPPAALPAEEGWDVRVYAISPGSARFLDACGAWSRLDPARVTPVREMQVVGDDGSSELRFSAYDAGVAELAFIAESRRLQNALWEAFPGQENLELFCPAVAASLELRDEVARLGLEDGRSLEARLVVGADGAGSRRSRSPTARWGWWRTSKATSPTGGLPGSGSGPTGCWRCCPWRGNGCPWCGPPGTTGRRNWRPWSRRRCVPGSPKPRAAPPEPCP